MLGNAPNGLQFYVGISQSVLTTHYVLLRIPKVAKKGPSVGFPSYVLASFPVAACL